MNVDAIKKNKMIECSVRVPFVHRLLSKRLNGQACASGSFKFFSLCDCGINLIYCEVCFSLFFDFGGPPFSILSFYLFFIGSIYVAPNSKYKTRYIEKSLPYLLFPSSFFSTLEVM